MEKSKWLNTGTILILSLMVQGKPRKNLSQRKRPGRNSNWAPPKYRCMTLLLHQFAQCFICITNMNVFLFPKCIIHRIVDSSSYVLYFM